jgi:myo-inositol-1(or 4)-monophosphatase
MPGTTSSRCSSSEHIRAFRGPSTEDGGLQGAADPEVVLVVDPIDGTRPAAAGFEMACVSVAAVPGGGEPTMGDVSAAAVQEIKSGDLFVAENGAGFSMRRKAGGDLPFRPTERVDLESLFWTLGFRGRPAVVLAGVLAELIDTSSVGGSVFDIGSATYSVTRILTGQLDAYVDIGPAIIAAHPTLEGEFRRVGRGHVLCNSPYDLAAVHLLCREAGVPIGDADGAPLDGRPVLGSDASYQMACIAAGNDGFIAGSSRSCSAASRLHRAAPVVMSATGREHARTTRSRLKPRDSAVSAASAPAVRIAERRRLPPPEPRQHPLRGHLRALCGVAGPHREDRSITSSPGRQSSAGRVGCHLPSLERQIAH